MREDVDRGVRDERRRGAFRDRGLVWMAWT